MNPLTQIRNTQKVSKAEIELGLTDKASWHDRFKHSAYVFAGGLPFELTEGDLLAVFAQYGEIVDLHLVRDKKTGARGGIELPGHPITCCWVGGKRQRRAVLCLPGQCLPGQSPLAFVGGLLHVVLPAAAI